MSAFVAADFVDALSEALIARAPRSLQTAAFVDDGLGRRLATLRLEAADGLSAVAAAVDVDSLVAARQALRAAMRHAGDEIASVLRHGPVEAPAGTFTRDFALAVDLVARSFKISRIS